MNKIRFGLPLLAVLIFCFVQSSVCQDTLLRLGAERMEEYLPLLKGKRVAIVANQTSVVRNSQGGLVHLADTLLSLGIDLRFAYCPEHGFRGNAEAGASVASGRDKKTGLSVISLYGKNKKPSKESLEGCDVVVFDLQDVGCRFYTYISTLHYVMQACAEQGKPIIVLDRPNPNDYVDGPVLEEKFRSFVGMHPVPVVYGLTIGEYALMIAGEGWLSVSRPCNLTVVKLEGWHHNMPNAYRLPVAPSPNLPTAHSVELYPALCLFEGTPVSVGRGTDTPFEIIGFPSYPDTAFSFTPRAIKGVSENPPYRNTRCYGLNNLPKGQKRLEISYIIYMYSRYPDKESFFQPFFSRLAGTQRLAEQIKASMSEEQIRLSWRKDLEKYEKIRERYLLYQIK